MTEAFFATPDEFRAWLGEHGTTADEVWVRMARKGSGIASIDWVQGVECALCFGWIDGQAHQGPTRLLPPALHAAARAHEVVQDQPREGRGAYRRGPDEPARASRRSSARRPTGAGTPRTTRRGATVPPELQAALDASPDGRRGVRRAEPQNRYAIPYRVQDAKRPDTRARRIAQFVAMLERGETIH